MQAIFETLFDTIYLSLVVYLGINMIIKGRGEKQYFLYGVMSVILGFGDAFHLIPRCIALFTTGLDDYIFALGIGKLITSITMTIFYVFLYYVWRQRYNISGRDLLTKSVYILSISRIILCLLPQNEWFSLNPPLIWGIYRNIPFTILGILIIVLFYKSAKQYNDTSFRFLYITIILSFAFYIPVVLFSKSMPIIGMLMIPKTCAYVWTVLIGYNDMKRSLLK